MQEHEHNNDAQHGDAPEEQPIPNTLREDNEEEAQQPIGPVVGSIIIVVLLILGGLYLWGAELSEKRQGAAQDQQLRQLQQQSTSTEIDAIEKDLEQTDLENIDKELEQIEKDLNTQAQ